MRDYCDAQAGFWLNSKFWSKFSSLPLSGIEDQNTPPPFRKTSDLGWPKFTQEYPPISENFRFGMTKVYSGIPPHFGKLQIWDDQSLLRNAPPFRKTSDLGWPKFTPEYPPPFRKTSNLGWPKFTLEYPPPFRKTSDLGWPKFTPEYPPHFGKLQIWDDQSLFWNTPPHFGKLQIWDDQSLLRNTPPCENCQRVQVWDFQNTESYYMWRLYPTRITTS